MSSDLYMVFDVESIGLHGEGFAVGYVVVNGRGETMAPDQRYACPPDAASGDEDGRAWIAENCPLIPATHATPHEVRDAFWRDWLSYKERHALLVADCAWPVEARFLAACVDDEPDSMGKAYQGPYPLHELASFMVAAGMDPHATYDRLPDEPQHDPLGDARQSARLLVRALRTLASLEARITEIRDGIGAYRYWRTNDDVMMYSCRFCPSSREAVGAEGPHPHHRICVLNPDYEAGMQAVRERLAAAAPSAATAEAPLCVCSCGNCMSGLHLETDTVACYKRAASTAGSEEAGGG